MAASLTLLQITSADLMHSQSRLFRCLPTRAKRSSRCTSGLPSLTQLRHGTLEAGIEGIALAFHSILGRSCLNRSPSGWHDPEGGAPLRLRLNQ